MDVGRGPETAPFAHASEAELARILDYYGIRWEYEPRSFPILWNLDGAVVESFAPDFYLPELDLYVELTTLRQSLVRKKNRKLRRLRELYPDVQIKLFYARDFRALMLKYGRIGLVDSLTGTEGQATPPRARRRTIEAHGTIPPEPRRPHLHRSRSASSSPVTGPSAGAVRAVERVPDSRPGRPSARSRVARGRVARDAVTRERTTRRGVRPRLTEGVTPNAKPRSRRRRRERARLRGADPRAGGGAGRADQRRLRRVAS